MRKTGRWMQRSDERILEVLNARGPATPHVIVSELRYPMTEGIVKDRCEKLAEAGLIAPDEILTRYELTTRGAEYLRGELDAEHYAPRLRRQIRFGHNRIIRV